MKLWRRHIAYVSTSCARMWHDATLWTLYMSSVISRSRRVSMPKWILYVWCSSPRWANLICANPLAYISHSTIVPCRTNVSAKWNNASCVSSIMGPAEGYNRGGFGVCWGHRTRFGSVLAPCLSWGIPCSTLWNSKISK